MARAELKSIVLQQSTRSRIRYELNQDINNFFIDLNETKTLQNSNQQKLLQKLTTAKYLSNSYLDNGNYFIEHLETTMLHQSNLRGIKYKLWVDKAICNIGLGIEQRYKIITLVYLIFEKWNSQNQINLDIIKSNNRIKILVYFVNEKTVNEIKHADFMKISIEEGHIVYYLDNN